METLKITFSNNETLTLHEGDVIIPITSSISPDDKPSSSMLCLITLELHTHDGLIPSLMDAFCNSDYFYVKSNNDTVWCNKSIIKIERI